MTTRVANLADINELVNLRLVNAAYHAGLLKNVAVKKTAEAYFFNHTQKCIGEERSTIIVGELENKVIAYAIGQIEDEHPVLDFGNQATIDDVFVSPSFEQKGYGQTLVKELMKWFKDKGIDRVDLNVYTSNPKGSAFWDKLEFRAMFRRMFKQL